MRRLFSVNIRLALFVCFVWSLACSVLCVWLYMIEILAHKLGVLNIFSKAANICTVHCGGHCFCCVLYTITE